MKQLFDTAQYISWAGAALVAAMTGVAFAYGTFQTKLEAHDVSSSVAARLDRLETKIDTLLERGKK